MKPWTSAEDNLIVLWWGTVSLDTICRRIGRGRESVYMRAHRMGLLRRNSGVMTAEQLTRHFGVHRDTLERAMEWANVKPLVAWRRRPNQRTQWTAKRYDADQAREAFEAWLSAETLADATRRYGRGDEGWVRRRLKAAGIYVAGKQGHRYPAEAIDRAVREYGGGAM